jgi:hypothetical protein
VCNLAEKIPFKQDSREATVRRVQRPFTCTITDVVVDAIDIGQIRTAFLHRAVLQVGELAVRDRYEAGNRVEELRRYFESVAYTLPIEVQHRLAEEIADTCGNLANDASD